MSNKVKKNKEDWTNDDYIKHYRKQYIACRVLTYVLLVLPMLVLVGCKFNYYFPTTTTEQKLSLAGSVVIGFVCLLLAIMQVAKKIEKKEITLFFTSIYWFASFLISKLMSNFFNDISLICLMIAIGVLASATANILAMNRKKWLDNYITGTTYARTSKNENKETANIKEATE